MRSLNLVSVAALLLLLSVGVAQAADVAVTVKDARTQAPVENVKVELYLSYGVLSGFTDLQGTVTFQDVRGRGFWLHLNGVKQSQFYRVQNSPFVVFLGQGGGR